MKLLLEAKKKAQALSKRKGVKLKFALEQIAKENGFPTWKDFKNSLDTFWYKDSSPFLNHWFVLYEEASRFKEEKSGYLLTYKGQYFVVSQDYIKYLDLDPDADIWKKINYDVSSSNALEKMYKYLKSQESE